MISLMKNYIFGYGSLIVPESATKTLGRILDSKDVFLIEVNNFFRTWDIVIPVRISNGMQEKVINAVFLNIQKNPNKVINGVLLQVTDEELLKLDIREKQYFRINITADVQTKLSNEYMVFTYIGKPEFNLDKYSNPKILDGYLKIIEKIQYWGKDFYNKFNLTTKPYNFEIEYGNYKFLDKDQNTLTGH